MTIAEDPSDVTSSPTTQAETVSHVSPTSTTNTIVIASDSGFDQSPDLVIIKIITISLSMAVMAIVMTTVVVLVTVVAMMWRRRRVNNSASTTMVEIESQNNANAEFNMTDNVSYNICDTDVLSHHYEYPDLSMTVLDESNIYDSIDS